FVPEAYSVSPVTDRRQHAGHLYDAMFLLIVHAAQALGVARHALDAFAAFASGPPRQNVPAVRDRPLAQLRYAEAEALVSSARAYIVTTTEDAWRTACSGEPVTLDQRARIRLAMTNAVQRAADAVDLIYDAAGAWAIYAANPLERCFRDIHTATQHNVVASPSYEMLGRILLGVDEQPAFVL
ncbi:MAG: acyl-CoA dehydrogenase family protein, partial [Vicinamibacterales bacterium]